MGKRRLGFIKYMLLIAVIFSMVWYWQNYMIPEAETAYIPIPAVKVERPAYGSLQKSITLGGYVEAENMITVLPQVGGQISSLYVEEGDMVASGDLIATIDRTSYQLQVDQAEAAYISAKSSFDRIAKLYDSGAATKQTYDQTKAQYDAYRSQLELAQLQLAYTEVTAPVAGTVLIRHASEGALVGSEVPIVTIADLNRLQVRIHVPEKYYDLFLERSSEIIITMTRPDSTQRMSRGHILRVASYIDVASKSFEVICAIDDPRLVRPGMYVTVNCVLEYYPDQYILPYEALTAEDTVWYVDPESQTAHRLSLKPLVESEDGFSISPEYKERLIIIEGQHFLQDGQTVHIIEEEGKEDSAL